jgi:hypothetical protein
MTAYRSRARFVVLTATATLTTTATTGVTHASATSPPPTVSFGTVPATAPLVAHYTVDQRTAAGPRTSTRRGQLGAAADLPLLRPGAVAGSTHASAGRGALIAPSSERSGGPDVALRSSFAGMQSSVSICPYVPVGCDPPDMAIAASPQFVLQGVNKSFEVLDTHGRVQAGWPRDSQAFFRIPNEPKNCDPASGNRPFVTDPRAFYDPVDKRFWAATLQLEGAVGRAPDCPLLSAYFIAVSQQADPRGVWNVYKFDMSAGTGNVADFTQLGMDRDGLYFSGNMFNAPGTAYEYAELFEANKRLMERGSTAFTASGFRSITVTGPGGTYLVDTVQPVLTLGSDADGEYFVNTFNGLDPVSGHTCQTAADACSGLVLWSLRNPIAHDSGGTRPVLTGRYVATRPYVFAPPASQTTCTQCIDASDLRISAIPVYRNGTVFAAWDTAIGNATQTVPGIEYAQVRVVQPADSTSSYYFAGGDTAVTFPAVMPDGSGNVVMVYDLMSSTVNPQTRFVTTRTDAAQFRGSGYLIKSAGAPYRPSECGTAALPVCRWGDYSASSDDGEGNIWLAGQYANRNVGPSTDPDFSSRNWGTWIVGLAIPR